MATNDIIKEIKDGLTGDRKHDVPYLQQQCKKYGGYESAQEILRACGRLICLVNTGCYTQAV